MEEPGIKINVEALANIRGNSRGRGRRESENALSSDLDSETSDLPKSWVRRGLANRTMEPPDLEVVGPERRTPLGDAVALVDGK